MTLQTTHHRNSTLAFRSLRLTFVDLNVISNNRQDHNNDINNDNNNINNSNDNNNNNEQQQQLNHQQQQWPQEVSIKLCQQ